MATVDDLDQVIEQYQRALNEFLKGNPEPHKTMFSHREDATLLNPFGSLDHGFEQVAERMERFASQVSDGEVTNFEVLEKYVTPELACIVWVERSKAKAGGRQRSCRSICGLRWSFDPKGAPGRWCIGTQTR